MSTNTKSPVHSSQLIAKLDTLRNQSGEKAFERVKIAKQLLEDRTWLASQFKGDDAKAEEYIEADYFGDLCGTISLSQLFEIYHKFPEIDEWKDRKFNLKNMYAEVKVGRPKEERDPVKRATLKELAEKDENIQELQFMVKRDKDTMISMEKENAALKADVQRLREENAELKGRVTVLERMSDRKTVAA